jgi:transcriptional regulator with XRE-family HTH domain
MPSIGGTRDLGDVRVRIGARVKQLRRSKRLTQAQLAARAGISAKTVGEVERGEANPTLSLLEDICSALAVEVAMLFDTADAPSAYIMTPRDLQAVREAMQTLDTVFGGDLAVATTRSRRKR